MTISPMGAKSGEKKGDVNNNSLVLWDMRPF